MDHQKRLTDVLECTGLTRSQVARLFGKTERTLVSWMQGIPMPQRAVSALDHIEKVLSHHPTFPPTEMRAYLLDSSKGASVFRKLLDAAPIQQQIQFGSFQAQLESEF